MNRMASQPSSASGSRQRPKGKARRRACRETMARAAQRQRLQRDAKQSKHGDQHRKCRDLRQDARTETGDPLIDQCGQRQIIDRHAEQRRNAEIADAGNKGERSGGDEIGPDHWQDDGQKHAER